MKFQHLIALTLLCGISYFTSYTFGKSDAGAGIKQCQTQIKKGIDSKNIDPDKYFETQIRENAEGEPRILVLMDDKSEGVAVYIATPDSLKKMYLDPGMHVDYLYEPDVVDFEDCSVVTFGFSYGGSSIPGTTLILKGDNLEDTNFLKYVTPSGNRDFYIEGEDYRISYSAEDDNWTGHCYYPYYPFYLDDKQTFVEYPARFVSRGEIEEMINLEPVLREAEKKDACPMQYILRENGDININFLNANKYGMSNFYAVVHRADGKLQWVLNEFDEILTEGHMQLEHPGIPVKNEHETTE